MKKVLYIGHYLEGNTGWSRAAQDYILALDSVGVDVVCRAVKLGYKTYDIPKRILELESKSLDGVDVCLQHVLPHHMVASPYRNIGLYANETDNFTLSGWANYLNLMDENIVICFDQLESAYKSGVNTPLHVVPHCYQSDRYTKPRKRIEGLPDDFIFYFIGEYNQRKNIPALLTAFHSEFSPSESVSLLLKLSSSEFNRDELLKQTTDLCNKVKSDLRIFPDSRMSKPEIIIVDNLTDDQILDIHYSCDCFVTASHGEAWGYPIMDALGMGKYPICPNQGGAKDMIDSNRVGQLVDCYDSPCINVKDTFSGLFIGKENWKSIDISQLKQRMRISYNRLKNKSLRGWVKSDSNIRIKNYDYERVGTKLKEIIYG